MRVDGGEAAQRTGVEPPAPAPGQGAQRQFERLLDKPEEPSLFARWQQGAPLEGLLDGAPPAAQRDLLWQIYQRGDESAQEIGKRLSRPVLDRLIERFGERRPPVMAAIDQPELRALMREFDPLAARREKVLLNVMAAIKGEQGVIPAEFAYLDELARRELMTLIPLNGMVNNLMRNSHKLDLEG
ncbi:MAG: YopR family T3SS polymerization control protein [Aeromonas sp.]|uniref:YopR family T3SS polymerization control protein n=1 Tax=Aeromonas sp. TaxID=647 RepID=UPI003F2CA0F0